MPATSEKQKKFMDAVAHNKGFAKKVGVPQSVGTDFSEASKGMKFGSGGEKTRADSQGVNRPKTNHGDMALFKKGGSMASKMNPGFMAMMAKKKPSKMAAFEKSGKDVEKKGMKEGSKADMALDKKQMMGMKKGGVVKRMNSGGSPVPVQQLPYMGPKKESAPKPIHPAGLGSGTSTTPKSKSMDDYKKGGMPMKKMAAGGLSGAHKAADGVASKGKTKGTQITMSGNKGMKSGGMAKKYC
jgi:hypothetical protein